ncbi:MAG: hypothetical protein MZV64_19360 [Ignavibacteriales bacterium]|nr:hypothetical protein [Ignavibacteriales bacterium]
MHLPALLRRTRRDTARAIKRRLTPGPYKLMRHPVITSFFGIATGLFLINPALTTLATLLYTDLGLYPRRHARRKTC